jgi:hypothetical protein
MRLRIDQQAQIRIHVPAELAKRRASAALLTSLAGWVLLATLWALLG